MDLIARLKQLIGLETEFQQSQIDSSVSSGAPQQPASQQATTSQVLSSPSSEISSTTTSDSVQQTQPSIQQTIVAAELDPEKVKEIISPLLAESSKTVDAKLTEVQDKMTKMSSKFEKSDNATVLEKVQKLEEELDRYRVLFTEAMNTKDNPFVSKVESSSSQQPASATVSNSLPSSFSDDTVSQVRSNHELIVDMDKRMHEIMDEVQKERNHYEQLSSINPGQVKQNHDLIEQMDKKVQDLIERLEKQKHEVDMMNGPDVSEITVEDAVTKESQSISVKNNPEIINPDIPPGIKRMDDDILEQPKQNSAQSKVDSIMHKANTPNNMASKLFAQKKMDSSQVPVTNKAIEVEPVANPLNSDSATSTPQDNSATSKVDSIMHKANTPNNIAAKILAQKKATTSTPNKSDDEKADELIASLEKESEAPAEMSQETEQTPVAVDVSDNSILEKVNTPKHNVAKMIQSIKSKDPVDSADALIDSLQNESSSPAIQNSTPQSMNQVQKSTSSSHTLKHNANSMPNLF